MLDRRFHGQTVARRLRTTALEGMPHLLLEAGQDGALRGLMAILWLGQGAPPSSSTF